MRHINISVIKMNRIDPIMCSIINMTLGQILYYY